VSAVIFAAEAVGTYYSMRTYLKSFYAATVTAVTMGICNSLYRGRDTIYPYWKGDIKLPAFMIPELVLFLGVGLVCGLLSPIFIRVVEKIYFARINPNLGKRKFLFFKMENLTGWKEKLLGICEKYVQLAY